MKIVIIGGSGLIGSKLASKLTQLRHEVIAASPSTGVNTITGEGLDTVLKDTDVVIDVANSPSFEDKAVLEFFETSGRNLLAAETKAGVKHHVALSVVGADRLPESGYLRAKVAQENLIKKSGIPYSIVRSTQFFEFLGAIISSAAKGDEIHLSTGKIQPISSDDVVSAVAKVAVGKLVVGMIEIGGPDRYSFAEIARKYMARVNDNRKVVEDPEARYFGTLLEEKSIVPDDTASLGSINFEAWMKTQQQTVPRS